MFDFEKADSEIEQNTGLVKDLEILINNIIETKKFQYTSAELAFDTTLLIAEAVLADNSSVLIVQENDLLYYVSLRKFYNKLAYTPTNDLQGLFVFLDKVRDYFSDSRQYGRIGFVNGLVTMAVLHQHVLYQPSFNAVADSWKQEKQDSFYGFSSAIAKILPQLQYDEFQMLALLQALYTAHEFEKPGIYNVSIAELDQGIELFAEAQTAKAKRLLDLLLDEFSEIKQRLLIPLLSGLLKQDVGFTIELDH